MSQIQAMGTNPPNTMDRIAAAWAGRLRHRATIIGTPEPCMIGEPAFGKTILEGGILLGGVWCLSDTHVPLRPSSNAAVDALHQFAWLDDLAALGTPEARARAQAGLRGWLAQFGRGGGPGWTAGLAGSRLLRWIAQSAFLLQDMAEDDQAHFARALTLHAAFLDMQADRAAPGLSQIMACAGRVYGALYLQGRGTLLSAALGGMAAAARRAIRADGSVASRNPEALLDHVEPLLWVAHALALEERALPESLGEVLDPVAQSLRVLRHADGALARFQGGASGQARRLAAALSLHDQLAHRRLASPPDHAMGFVRLAAGRVSLIVDAAPPPTAAPASAHASTLAFQMTSNRRAVIVSCGDGESFGPDLHRAGRATASHSTLAFEGYSSARFTTGRRGAQILMDGPRNVAFELRHTADARAAALGHDGFRASHGLEHTRFLELSSNGRRLLGEDTLYAPTPEDEARFDMLWHRTRGGAFDFALRFHLHPDVRPRLDPDQDAVTLTLGSGEVWRFRAKGHELALAPSIYLEKEAAQPRPSQQIVLSLRANRYTSQINWRFAKDHGTPLALRDLAESDPLALPEV